MGMPPERATVPIGDPRTWQAKPIARPPLSRAPASRRGASRIGPVTPLCAMARAGKPVRSRFLQRAATVSSLSPISRWYTNNSAKHNAKGRFATVAIATDAYGQQDGAGRHPSVDNQIGEAHGLRPPDSAGDARPVEQVRPGPAGLPDSAGRVSATAVIRHGSFRPPSARSMRSALGRGEWKS
jgi:hypothetical protein